MNEHNSTSEMGAGVGTAALSGNQKTCFVIMPFSKTTEDHTEAYWTSFYENFVMPAMELQGFAVHRSAAKTGKISKHIVQDLAYSDVVLAILTDHNPNVLYELGVRHSSRWGTIMAIEDGQERPSDVMDYGFILYNREDRQRFDDELKQHIASIHPKDNPVADFLKIESNIAVNMAVGNLRHCGFLISQAYSAGGWPEVEKALNNYQASLPKGHAQVSVVEGGRLVFHADDPRPDLSECWKNVVEHDVSFLPTMLKERDGMRVGSVREYDSRLTAIAFETLSQPQCLVVAEAHYWQEGSRPY